MNQHNRALKVCMAVLLLAILAFGAIELALAEPSVSKLVLNRTSATIGIRSYNNGFTIKPTTTIYSNKKTNKAYGFPDVTYVSSDESVAVVIPAQDGSSARIESAGAGTAVIKAYVGTSLKARCTVKVKNVMKASSIRLSKSSLTRYATTLYDDPDNSERNYQFNVNIEPSLADASGDLSLIEYISSNPSVCEVDENGKLLAIKAGKARITAKLLDGSGKQSSCVMTIKSLPPKRVTIENGKTAKLEPGNTLELKTSVFPEHVKNGSIRYSSSKPSVAKVNQSGLITAVAPGTAKVYAKACIGSKQAVITVTVDYKYRFYAIANGTYRQDYLELGGAENDLKAMQRIYSTARFEGGKVKVGGKKNLTGAQMRSYLKSFTSNKEIEDDDVTIFYYSGHGADPDFGTQNIGAMCGVDTKVIETSKGYGFANEDSIITMKELASTLDDLPGQVIVIIDCCNSGAFITGKSMSANRLLKSGGSATTAASINRAVISAFSSRGSVTAKSTSAAKGLSPVTDAKFHVITACSETQSAYEDVTWSTMLGNWTYGMIRSFFTYYVECATSGAFGLKLLADTNSDDIVSIRELYTYVVARQKELTASDKYYDKHGGFEAQMWSMDETFGAFAIN